MRVSIRTAGILFYGMLLAQCSNQGVGSKPKEKAGQVYTADTSLHFSQSTESALDAFWDHMQRSQGFNGVVLSSSNDSIYARAFGYANIEKKIPLRLDQPFQIASISKTFCASAIMLLMEQKKIRLSDTVNRYLKDFPYPGISIEHLLSHQSGLPEYMHFTDKYWKDKQDKYISNRDVYNMLLVEKPAVYAQPGKTHFYCNTNFVLLTLIIEKLSKMRYPEFLKENIFKPLGMKDTRVADESDILKAFEVQGHYGMGAVVPDHYLNGTYGDKNILSTVYDLFRFYHGLKSGDLLKQSALDEMVRIRCHNVRGPSHYALGWRRRYEQCEEWAFHAGRWGGFRTNFYFSLNSEKCIVLLNNRMSGAVIKGSILTELTSRKGALDALHSYLPGWHEKKEDRDSLM